MPDNTYYLNNDRNLDLVERSGGLILSMCIHVALFSVLFINKYPARYFSEDEPGLIRVSLVEIPDEEFMHSQEQVEFDSLVEGGMSGDMDHGSGEGSAEADANYSTGGVKQLPLELPVVPTVHHDPAEQDPILVEGPDDSGNFTDEQLDLLEVMAERSRQHDAMNRQLAETGSGTVSEKLKLLNVDQVAEKTLFSDRGIKDGAIRKFDIADVPPEVAQEVLDRYGIRIFMSGRTRETGSGKGFLYSAHTSGGLFVNAAGGGRYHIFSYSQAAKKRFVQLETEALREKGHHPDKVRIITIVFGILSTGSGYDLGVRKISVEPVLSPVHEEAGDDVNAGP
jgi:hypothetical protein